MAGALIGALFIIFSLMEGSGGGKSENSFRWTILFITILLPPYLFWWVLAILVALLTPNPFWWEWVKKVLWDPFWWVILFLSMLWVPFLRVWWWIFLPLMLSPQLKKLYLWWLAVII
jgi:hypothetical protein